MIDSTAGSCGAAFSCRDVGCPSAFEVCAPHSMGELGDPEDQGSPGRPGSSSNQVFDRWDSLQIGRILAGLNRMAGC